MKKSDKLSNPFSITFGNKPKCYISRTMEFAEITENFEGEYSSSNIYMIMGVRGSGKTVLLTELSEYFEDRGWIIIDVSGSENIIQTIIGNLLTNPGVKSLFTKTDLSISIPGIELNAKREYPTVPDDVILDNMLKKIKNKRILIALDEAVNNKNIRNFTSLFQKYTRKGYPLYLLMTGLYSNIDKLQNGEDMTFLFRAPKIHLKPLSLELMAEKYGEIFSISERESIEMAKMTNGYSYAFQMLGYLRWKNKDNSLSQILSEYDYILEEYAYSKMWSELSDIDRSVLITINKSKEKKVKDIREALDMSSSLFSTYRKRLVGAGLIEAPKYGTVNFVLPRFDVFLKEQEE